MMNASIPNSVTESQKITFNMLIKEKEFWVLLLLPLIYFYRPLFLGESFFFRDLYTYFLPQRQTFFDSIHQHQFPLWDPYLYGGQPYFQYIWNAVLYPSSLLYIFFPLLNAFNLEIVGHIICLLLFTYMFARILGLTPIGSFIVAIIHGFCGSTLSLMNMLNLLRAATCLPLILLGWHLFLKEKRSRWFVLTALTSVFQIFACFPELSLLTFLFLLGWTVTVSPPSPSHFRRIFPWIYLMGFIGGLASIQIIPAIEMFARSNRATGLYYETISYWSVHPKQFLEMLFPQLFGRVDRLPWDIHYWGHKLVSNDSPYLLSLYLGWATIVLGIWGGMDRTPHPLFNRRIRLLLFGMVLFSFLFSLGRFLPFFKMLYQYLPGFQTFRYPIKFLVIGILPLALLAGYMTDRHFHPSTSPWRPSSRTLVCFWGITGGLIALRISFAHIHGFAEYVQWILFQQSSSDLAHQGLLTSFTHAAILWGGITLLYQYRRLTSTPWQHVLLAGLVTIDLLQAGQFVNFYVPNEFYTREPPLPRIIRQEIGEGRVFRPDEQNDVILQVPKDNQYNLPYNHLSWGYRWNLSLLSGHLAIFYRIPLIFQEDIVHFANKHVMELNALLEELPWEQKIPILSAAAVTLIISPETIHSPALQSLMEIPNWSDTRFFLYRNTAATPRVAFVPNWETVSSDHDALARILTPGYDPQREVIIQSPETTFSLLFSKTSPSRNFKTLLQNLHAPATSFRPGNSCNSVINKHATTSLTSVQYAITTACDGYVVFAEPWYPGWQVKIDGHSVPILRANYAFSAVFLTSGEHRLERYYRPDSLFVGITISIGSSLLLAFVCMKGGLQ